MKKKILCLVLSLLLITISLMYFLNINKKPKVYKLDMYSNYLILKDFTMVSFNNYIYIDKNSYLELIGDTNISEITLQIYLDDKLINSLGINDTFKKDNKSYPFTDMLLSNCKIKDNSTIKYAFKYKVDNSIKEYTDTVKIKDHQDKNLIGY